MTVFAGVDDDLDYCDTTSPQTHDLARPEDASPVEVKPCRSSPTRGVTSQRLRSPAASPSYSAVAEEYDDPWHTETCPACSEEGTSTGRRLVGGHSGAGHFHFLTIPASERLAVTRTDCRCGARQ